MLPNLKNTQNGFCRYPFSLRLNSPCILIALLITFFNTQAAHAAGDTTDIISNTNTSQRNNKRINLIISPRVGKADPGTISFQIQAFIQRTIRRRKLHLVIAGSSEEMYLKTKK